MKCWRCGRPATYRCHYQDGSHDDWYACSRECMAEGMAATKEHGAIRQVRLIDE